MSDSPPPPPGPPDNQPRPRTAQQPQPQPNNPGQPPPIPQPPPAAAVPANVLAAQLLLAGAMRGGSIGPLGGAVPIVLPVAQTQEVVQIWQGQYPPPESVEHYEKVLPGSFDRMIAMAERLQAAQIDES